MRTTKQWITEKVSVYNENPKEALEYMLSTTNNIIEQYIKNPNNTTKGVLDACFEHNKLFLQKVGIIDVDDLPLSENCGYFNSDQCDCMDSFCHYSENK